MLGEHWYNNAIILPDLRFDYQAHRIKLRSDNTSVLMGYFTMKGTKLITEGQEEANYAFKATSSSRIEDLEVIIIFRFLFFGYILKYHEIID
jgi:hypothetical protein